MRVEQGDGKKVKGPRCEAGTRGAAPEQKGNSGLLCTPNGKKRQIIGLLQTLSKDQQVLETFRDQPRRLYPCLLRRQRADSVETILRTRTIPCLRQTVGI
jgi:hypothetical protein